MSKSALAFRGAAASQRPRLQATLTSAGGGALQSIVLALYAWTGQLSWAIVGGFAAASVGSSLAFALLIHKGWSQRLKDPNVLCAQIVTGCAVQMGFLMLAPQLWFVFTTVVCVTYVYALMSFPPRRFTGAWLVISAGLGIALYAVRDRFAHPGVGPLDIFLLWLCIFLSIGHLRRIGLQFSTVRAKLGERKRELAASLSQLESVAGQRRLMDRERTARDLHDTLLQGLHGLLLRLQTATERIPPQEPARRMLEEALERADQLLLDGRDGQAKLYMAGSAAVDLPQALIAAGEELASACVTRFRFDLKGSQCALRPSIDEEVYRVGREAMLNAFQHANAREVGVTLNYGERELVLQVRDDGVGLDSAPASAAPAAGGAGMTDMRRRASGVGATLSARSVRGQGTEVELTVAAALAYFSLTLPPASACEASSSGAKAAPPIPRKANRVLPRSWV